jgi:hypothetical protein
VLTVGVSKHIVNLAEPQAQRTLKKRVEGDRSILVKPGGPLQTTSHGKTLEDHMSIVFGFKELHLGRDAEERALKGGWGVLHRQREEATYAGKHVCARVSDGETA